MRTGGLLDQFPLHLLTGGDGEFPTLVVDGLELGRLHLNRMHKGRRRIIVLSRSRRCLEDTRQTMTNQDGLTHLVVADPKWLPFRDQSIEKIVTLSYGQFQVDRSTSSDGTSATASEEFRRILTHMGWIVEIIHRHNWSTIREPQKTMYWAKTWRYIIRPASGLEYFVTREWIPQPWPFKSLHLGRFKSVYIGAQLLASRIGIRSLYDCVSLVVRSKTHTQCLIDRWTTVPIDTGCGMRPSPSSKNCFGLFVKACWNALLLGDKRPETVVKFPLSPVVSEKMKRQGNNLDALYTGRNQVLKSVLPRIVDQGITDGQAYWVETRIEGITATKYWWIPGWGRRVAESGFSFLMDLHQLTHQPTHILRSLFDELLDPHVATVEKEAKKIDQAFDMGPLVEALWDVFRERYIPMVHTHGDFWPGNLLVSKSAEIMGVLDWDTSLDRGWPMLDLLHLIAFQQKWRATWYFGSIVTKKLMRCKLVPWEHKMVEEYCTSMGIGHNLWSGFVALYWLNRSSQCIGPFDEIWVRRNVIKPLPQILKQVKGKCLP